MNDSSNKKKIAIQLIAQVNEFPPLPAVVNKILQVTADPESSLDKLARIVEAEVGLSAAVIKLANSPFFGLSREVSSIQHALVVLGMEEVRNMVLAKAMFNTFTSYRKKGDRINALWGHSFHTAMAAQVIADKMGCEDSGLFVGGLIHDIGKMVIFLAFSGESLLKVYGDTEKLDDSKKEIAFLGLNHEDLGRLLIKSWLFPEALQMAVGYHHSPESAPNFQRYPLVVRLADTLALLTVVGIEGEEGASLCLPFLDPPLSELYAKNGLPLTLNTIKNLFNEAQKTFAKADDLVSLLSG
ncbi:MAG: HDOD domain-containing protein [Proteobacteria bacterium]|nr:HDOD domain-containing protein [Pseudomonadota bacterium]MBU1640050.1 HDOD domain-containing protein [Pseudomonadota bacterium]